MSSTPRYPTRAHEQAAAAIVAFFSIQDETDAVLLINSCARGKATRDSCLDMHVLVPEGTDASALAARWQSLHDTDPVFGTLRQAGTFAVVHLDISDGRLDLIPHPPDEYPDTFEIAIGNLLVYSLPSGSARTVWHGCNVCGYRITTRTSSSNG